MCSLLISSGQAEARSSRAPIPFGRADVQCSLMMTELNLILLWKLKTTLPSMLCSRSLTDVLGDPRAAGMTNLQDCICMMPSLNYSVYASPRPQRKLLLLSQTQFNTLTRMYTKSGGNVALYTRVCENEVASLTKMGLYR